MLMMDLVCEEGVRVDGALVSVWWGAVVREVVSYINAYASKDVSIFSNQYKWQELEYKLQMFSFWRHICLTYDAFRDVYKLYVDGEKVDSGSFAGDNRQDDVGPSASVLPYIRPLYPLLRLSRLLLLGVCLSIRHNHQNKNDVFSIGQYGTIPTNKIIIFF